MHSIQKHTILKVIFILLLSFIIIPTGALYAKDTADSLDSTDGGGTAPAAPTLNVPSATQTSVSLSWNSVSGATGYRVYYAGGTLITTTSSTSYTHTGRRCGTSYSYYVTAYNSYGTSSASNTRTITTIPCTPSGLSASNITSTSATFSWSNVSGETGYSVRYYGVSKDPQVGTWNNVGANVTSYAFSGLVCEAVYDFQVYAYNSSGSSSTASYRVTLGSCDTTGPTITLSPTSSNWATSYSVTVTASDPSGISSLKRCVTTTSSCTPSADTVSGQSYPHSTEGQWTWFVTAIDGAGNSTTVSHGLYKNDSSAPTPNPPTVSSSSITSSSASVSIASGSDSLSGLNATAYGFSVDGGSYSWQSSTSKSITGLSCGTSYTVYGRIRDYVGNFTNAGSTSFTTSACPPPTAPSGATGTDITQSSIRLYWTDNSSNETGFRMYQNGSQVTTVGVNTTTYTFSGLSCGTAYTLGVASYNGDGTSSQSSTTVSTSACPPPTAPSGATGTDITQSSIRLYWTDNSSNETGFRMYRNGSQVTTVGVNTTTYTFSGLSCGTSYTLGVAAYNGDGTSSQSSTTVSTIICSPTAPSSPSLITMADSSQILSWTDNSNNESGFYIYQWNGSSWVYHSSVGVDVASKYITGLSCGTSYTFGVQSYNGGGSSSIVSSNAATTYPCVVAPTLSSTLSSPTQISFSWNNVANELRYGLYQSNGTAVDTNIPADTTTYSLPWPVCGSSSFYIKAAYQHGIAVWSDPSNTVTQTITDPSVCDTTGPETITFSPESRITWDSSDATATVTVSDSQSSVSYVRHCWTTSASCDPGTSTSNTFTNGSTVPAQSSSGAWNLCIRGRDSVGNWGATQCSGVYRVDKTAPTPNPPTLSASSITSSSVSISISSGSDSHSGLNSTAYGFSVNGGAYSWQSSTSKSITGLSCGTTYTVYGIIRDAVANQTSAGSTSFTTPPCNPSGLSATAASQTQINLSWTAATGATGYKVYRGATLLGTTTTTTYSDPGRTCGTSYSYSVIAYNGSGDSGSSNTASTYTISCTPTNLSGSATSQTQINLSWTAVSGNVTGYKIYRDGAYLTSTASTSYSNTPLTPCTSYTYTVRSYNSSGTSPDSNQVIIPTICDTTGPETTIFSPESRAWSTADATATVTVSDSQSSISYVRHCWTTSASCDPGTSTLSTFTNGSTVPAQSTSGSWNLCIRARDSVGNWNSGSCSAGLYRVDKTAPTPNPPTVTAQVNNQTSVAVSLSTASDAHVGLHTSPYGISINGGAYTWYAAKDQLIGSLTCGTNYTFSGKLRDSLLNETNPGTSSQVTTAPCTPPVPTGVSASGVSQTQINITWNASAGASGYYVYRDGAYIASSGTNSYSNTTGLSCGTSYSYTVRSFVNGTGGPYISNYSTADSGTTVVCTPPVPTGLNASTVSQTQINLTWNASSGATSYLIYRNGAQIASTGQTSYSNTTGLSCGTPYTYTVRASNVGGTSGDSASSAATTSNCVTAPTVLENALNFQVRSGSYEYTATWQNASADGYVIYRIDDATGSLTPMTDTNSLTHTGTFQPKCPAEYTVGFYAYNTDPTVSSIDSTCTSLPSALGTQYKDGRKCSTLRTTDVDIKHCTQGFLID